MIQSESGIKDFRQKADHTVQGFAKFNPKAHSGTVPVLSSHRIAIQSIGQLGNRHLTGEYLLLLLQNRISCLEPGATLLAPTRFDTNGPTFTQRHVKPRNSEQAIDVGSFIHSYTMYLLGCGP